MADGARFNPKAPERVEGKKVLSPSGWAPVTTRPAHELR